MNDWQPIDTAPKDGTKILVCPFQNKTPVIASWDEDKYAKKPRPFWRWDWWQVGRQRENQPKVWQPLPDPPKETP